MDEKLTKLRIKMAMEKGKVPDDLFGLKEKIDKLYPTKKEPQIIIVIEGGVVQAVHSNTPISYRIIDFDDIKATEENPTDAIGTFYDMENDSLFEDIEETTKEIITEI